MRRAVLPFVVGAALAWAWAAHATLQPLQRTYGEQTLPRVRTGMIVVPRDQASGRIRVIVRLRPAPLAAWSSRTLANARDARRLDVHAPAARAYLTQVARAQARAAAQLRAAVPQARIGRRFRIILDGLTVTLPAQRLPQLVRLPFVSRVYSVLRYTEELDRSPSVIGADVLRRVAGADGSGVKIAIVDDGIDQTNPFFDPRGYAYPPGFPRGSRRWTTPKVIVAKVFPGPHAGAAGRRAVDPRSSFHGTHVAGIAAGDAGTTAPAGTDHPRVTGLSGVAPRAWLGNYRVFTVPTPIGHVANTPEIIAAFENAVADGMDVINFSGGGAQTDPQTDALVEAVRNIAAAGVVPVIAAGNDGDDFGLGSAATPGTAPDAISVAAVTSGHVFGPTLRVTQPGAPAALHRIPFVGAAETRAPAAWSRVDQRLVDVTSITGRDGKRVEPHLCRPKALPPHSLDRAIALAQRGICPFTAKAAVVRAAGAVGLILVDNRPGDANEIPLRLAVPAGTISDADGRALGAYLATTRGRTRVRVGHALVETVTRRSGVVTSFSSGGPTPFGHSLKPDVAAPGGQILSATLPRTNASRFAVFDGTSMAAPHVAGGAALLRQLHPAWSPRQVKSALVSTAGAAWADTQRTREASVLVEGAGLVDLPRAAQPLLFSDPTSLSFGDLDVSSGSATRTQLVQLADSGGGAGTWRVDLAPQSTTPGTGLDVPGTVDIAPGGDAELPVVARAAAGATPGEQYGFVVLRRGDVTRRIPYLFVVERPALANATATPLRKVQRGDTRVGRSRVQQYAYPVAPFGDAPDQPHMREDGAEHLYVTHLSVAAANVGVAVIQQPPRKGRVDPFLLGAPDENEVQGLAGTPVDVNELTADYLVPIGAAAAVLPRRQAFYVSVDSGRGELSGRRLGGRYVLRSWVNDVTPPRVRLVTTTVAAGRPTLVLRASDAGAGVDPYSVAVSMNGTIVGASSYDPFGGIAIVPLTDGAELGTQRLTLRASDFQEAKNVNTFGTEIMPNTRFVKTVLHVVAHPVVTWVLPAPRVCAVKSTRLLVAPSSADGIRSVRFRDGDRVLGTAKPRQGLATLRWKTMSARAGRHTIVATATATGGRVVSASRIVRVCR